MNQKKNIERFQVHIDMVNQRLDDIETKINTIYQTNSHQGVENQRLELIHHPQDAAGSNIRLKKKHIVEFILQHVDIEEIADAKAKLKDFQKTARWGCNDIATDQLKKTWRNVKTPFLA